MTPTQWILLAPLAAGLAAIGHAAWRYPDLRDARVAVAAVLLAALAARILVAPSVPALEALGSTPDFEGRLPLFLVDLLGNGCAALAAVVVLRSLRERNRAESAHWDGMEALRHFSELSAGRHSGFDERVSALLGMGCQRFALECGLLVRVPSPDAPEVEVVAVEAPADLGMHPGRCPELDATLCARAAQASAPLAVDRASQGHWQLHPSHAPFGFEAFLGAPVGAPGAPYGALCFASRSERERRFSGMEKTLISLMAQWVEHQLLLSGTGPATAGNAESSVRSDRQPDKQLVPRYTRPADDDTCDADAELARLQPQLERTLRGAHGLELTLAGTLPRVCVGRREFERTLRSLVEHAAQTQADGGRISIATAHVAPSEDAEGIGTGFVTLAVRSHGPALDADALGALYDGRGLASSDSPHAPLPLPQVVRLLREPGGDLSLESEEGRGTTLTAWLPVAGG